MSTVPPAPQLFEEEDDDNVENLSPTFSNTGGDDGDEQDGQGGQIYAEDGAAEFADVDVGRELSDLIAESEEESETFGK